MMLHWSNVLFRQVHVKRHPGEIVPADPMNTAARQTRHQPAPNGPVLGKRKRQWR
jgi:hypothetical protein